MRKKVLSLLLASTMLVSLAACGKGGVDNQDVPDVAWADMDYNQASAHVYQATLGEFASEYAAASKAQSVSEKYALQAIAEAKFLETGVMLPTTSQGGNYAISRAANNTKTGVLWGTDNERNHQLIVCTEPVTSEDRAEMKAKFNELKGTGTYEAWLKDYLAQKGYTTKDSYSLANNADPVTWDAYATSEAADSEKLVQLYDGLMEYDIENVLQPALATSYEVSADEKVYTFHLRDTVWVDSQGRKVADLVADDFVAGFQHVLDCPDAPWYLVEGLIEGVDEYLAGEITDFSQVGVKAVDEHTVQYTLTAPAEYFITMLGYSVFAPMSRSYYESQGGKFGADYDPSAASYTFGKGPDNIAYCGPYVVTNFTEKNIIKFEANESYWNKDNINIKVQNWLFNDGSDATKAYNDMKAGTIDGCGLNASALELAKADGWFDKYQYITANNATTYSVFLNINRGTYHNFNDETVGNTTQSESDAMRTKWAMNNVHFRRAVCFAIDRGAWNAQSVGDELALTSMRNSYTPGNFVFLDEDVTVEINGKATTFKAGTYYGEILQAQLDADNVPIKAWDPTLEEGAGSSDGYDGWYNLKNAESELKEAIKELKAEGIEISKKNPIYIDFPFFTGSTVKVNQAEVLRQSLEKALDGCVVLNKVELTELADWYYAGYYPSTGDESNFDICDLSGWAPDYGDPKSYLDTFLADGSGYMTKMLGIY